MRIFDPDENLADERPDITNAMLEVARHTQDPRETRWRAVLKSLEYLDNAQTLRLSFWKGISADLVIYADSDYHVKSNENQRWVSGGSITFAGATVSLYFKPQRCVTLSATEEAKYVAMAGAVKETMFSRP